MPIRAGLPSDREINALAERVEQYANSLGDQDIDGAPMDEAAGRVLLQAFVDAYDNGKVGGSAAVIVPVVHALRRVLEVDMTQKANRRGDVPAALGLVVRERRKVALVVFAYEQARYSTGGLTKDGGRPLIDCDSMVLHAFDRLGGEFKAWTEGEDPGMALRALYLRNEGR